jgi:hypothetical protein
MDTTVVGNGTETEAALHLAATAVNRALALETQPELRSDNARLWFEQAIADARLYLTMAEEAEERERS